MSLKLSYGIVLSHCRCREEKKLSHAQLCYLLPSKYVCVHCTGGEGGAGEGEEEAAEGGHRGPGQEGQGSYEGGSSGETSHNSETG